jgi:hypothetical protein
MPIEEAGREYSSDHKKLQKMAAIILQVTSQSISSSGEWGVTYLLKNESYKYKTDG